MVDELGCIIRDSDGDAVSAGRGRLVPLPHLIDPFQAEMIVCLRGIQAAINIGFSKIIIVEIDAMMVKLTVETKDRGLSVAGRIIQEILKS